MPVPERRLIIVLATLLGAMTLAAGLLLALEPTPVNARPGTSLQSVDRSVDHHQFLFATDPQVRPRRWTTIVINDSSTLAGSASTVGELHERFGADGLGYHFVIGNGSGSSDGQIEIGYRWRNQDQAAQYYHGQTPLSDPGGVIAICLIGDTERAAPTELQSGRLLWLVRQLQARYRIDADHVRIHTGYRSPDRPGPFFPTARFKQQLLEARGR